MPRRNKHFKTLIYNTYKIIKYTIKLMETVATKKVITLNENTLLDNINSYYMEAVDRFEHEIEDVENNLSFLYDASDEAIFAFRIANDMLIDMLNEHVIEDFDWNGSFVPQYDWMSINLEKLNHYAWTKTDIENYYLSTSDFSKCLLELSKAGAINNFMFHDDYFSMDINNFNSKSLNEFTVKYESLRDSLLYFS